MDPNETVIPKTRQDIPTKAVEVKIESSGIGRKETVFSDTTDPHKSIEKNAGSAKQKPVPLYPKTDQSSQCRVIMAMSYTMLQQL